LGDFAVSAQNRRAIDEQEAMVVLPKLDV